MLFCSCQHNQHRGKSQPAYSWYLTLNMTNRDNETDETKVGWRRQRENGSQGTICWYELNHTVVHKTWLSKGRSGNRGRRFSATWNSEAQMELLTHCFNTIVFYQLLTVADERGKKRPGDKTSRDISLPFASQIDTVNSHVCWNSD